jgi:hypothetical protein
MTPGKETSEYKLSVISNAVPAVVALLIAYGILSAEEAELWQAVVMAIIAIAAPLATTVVTREYTRARTGLKLEAMGQDLQPGAAQEKPEAAE